MQRRLQQAVFPTKPSAACCTTAFSVVVRKVSNNSSSGVGRVEDEDPAAVLRQLQEDARRRAATEAKEAPPAPLRRSGKTIFFENAGRSATDAASGQHGAATPPVSEARSNSSSADGSRQASAGSHDSVGQTTSNPFLQKLSKMESDSQLPSFPTYNAAAEERRKKNEARIKEERSKMLVFRDVGMDLDKPILSRDVFLVLKYFRYGMAFAVDNELERMLRYFNEHATNELKIIQDSKLMRGPPTLSRKRRSAPRQRPSTPLRSKQADGVGASVKGDTTGPEDSTPAPLQQGLQFQVSSAFPHVRCANTRQFCPPAAFSVATASKLVSLLGAPHSSSSFASFFPPTTGKETSAREGKVGNFADDASFTTVTPSTFRRPAVVIFSQLGQRFGSQADAEWRRLAYATLCPGLLPYIPVQAQAHEAAESAEVPKPRDRSGPSAPSSRAMPIDVISLRSADVYKYAWVQRLYMRRFAKSLSQPATSTAESPASVTEVRNALIASTTFVGSQLLEPFYATLGLRNYLFPHVMLVDHDGVVRWLSGGLPDAEEMAAFPSLLRQLESEYLKATS
ncbi:hypothetical protein NESM_000688400 [Novymonas esmeraldas]|uniref:Uncharacterized protein n=1 Tax=Novymonas esmeraldas TaxID=1808958 RepID=A0AAW0ET50_9TRYP